jgi:hypothetical protein
MHRLALVAVALAALAGPAAAADSDHVIRPYGLHLALPASWPSLSAADAGKPAAVAALTRVDPAYAGYAEAMRAAANPLKFVALDPRRSDGFVTNLSLLVLPLPGRPSLEAYRRSLLARCAPRTSRLCGRRSSTSCSGLRSA